jgi:hypothetical protein
MNNSAILDMLALKAATDIEDEFVRAHPGGVVQRRAAIQCHVRSAIRQAFAVATDGLINSDPNKS